MSGQYRRAILVIHGMGEQHPLDTLDNLAKAVLSRFTPENQRYYSRPTEIGGSYEARRYIIPPVYEEGHPDARPQTDLFEYHWSPKMTGNRLDDLTGTVRRILWRWPWEVPGGIRGLWAVLWALLIAVGIAVAHLVDIGAFGDAEDLTERIAIVLQFLLGTGVAGAVVSWVVTRLLPKVLTGTFVDVVRYLDPSPRSHDVRRDIRRGAVEMLRELNAEYDRVIIVAHSLGSYIAYDAIRQLWGELNTDYDGPAVDDPPEHGAVPAGLDALEAAATPLIGPRPGSASDLATFRAAQRALSKGLREAKLTWRVTDLVSMGSPMYMADQLYTRNRAEFDERVAQHEFPTCPPVDDYASWTSEQEPARQRRYTYHRTSLGRRVLYDAAPFAVVRWTNLWFPTRALLFGDYFGGPLGPLFGHGIRDVPITSGTRKRLLPGMAHSLYFRAIADEPQQQVGREFHEALRL